MDIQDTKEQRQAFEAWCIQWNIASVFPLDDEGQYSDYNIHLLYCAWLQGQAAKAQAVPDGFMVVNQKDLLELTIAINAVDLATHTESKTNEVREMWQQVALKLGALCSTGASQ